MNFFKATFQVDNGTAKIVDKESGRVIADVRDTVSDAVTKTLNELLKTDDSTRLQIQTNTNNEDISTASSPASLPLDKVQGMSGLGLEGIMNHVVSPVTIPSHVLNVLNNYIDDVDEMVIVRVVDDTLEDEEALNYVKADVKESVKNKRPLMVIDNSRESDKNVVYSYITGLDASSDVVYYNTQNMYFRPGYIEPELKVQDSK